ncbi:MAG: DUF2892 domain-containing protein [Actinomycetota bacterium]
MQRTQKVKNVGTAERWVRVIGGALLAFVGLAYLLAAPESVFAWVLGAVFVLLGADFVYTGITGYCPLYNKLGWSTARRTGPGGRARS